MMVAGNIPGLTQTASLAIFDAVAADDPARAGFLSLLVAGASTLAVVVAQRTLPGRGHGR